MNNNNDNNNNNNKLLLQICKNNKKSYLERDANIFHPFLRESSVCVY